MSEPAPRRFPRLTGRKPGTPGERDWERCTLLTPRAAAPDPQLISDGGGLPFPPAALNAPGGALSRDDPAVAALVAQIARQKAPKGAPAPGVDAPAADQAQVSLDGWRLLARTDDEVLFGHGRPPHLLTVAMRLDPKRQTWSTLATNATRPLRACRDGIRASRWRLDPAHQTSPQDTLLRVLVTEQTFAGGKRADDRLLVPDLYLGEHQLVLRIFISPRPGFQTRSNNPETLARIALPEPLGDRRPIDGALYPR